MVFLFASALIGIWACYLLYKVNELTKNIYSWQRTINFKDFSNKKEINIIYSSESMQSNHLSLPRSLNLVTEFENSFTENGTYLIPNKMTFISFVTYFQKEKDPIANLREVKEEDIVLFANKQRLDFPSAIINNEFHNIYVKYSIFDLDKNVFLSIKTWEDFLTFIDSVYTNNKNYSFKAIYMNYKKVGRQEEGDLTAQLELETKIGPNYSNINYGKPYMFETKYLEED